MTLAYDFTTVRTEERPCPARKSMIGAYLLLIMTGGIGLHRFYLGRIQSALIMMTLFVVGLMTMVFYIGHLSIGILLAWLVADLFLIPGMVANPPEED